MAREGSRLSAASSGAAAARAGVPVSSRLQRALPLALVAAVAALVFAIYGSTFASMVAVWARSQTFAHGFLILPVAAWLLYRNRAALAASTPSVSAWGALALGACVLAWSVGHLLDAAVIAQGAIMAMIPAALLLIVGVDAVRAIAFALVFALLAVPAGEFLIEPMMDLTAYGSVFLLTLSGVPVYQDGWLISLPGANFQVADACSGVRYLIGAATTGLLFAYLFFRTQRKRFIFMLFVIVLTVLANVVRAYIIILLAHLTDLRLAVGVDHFIYGWFLFSLLLLLVFAVGLKFADVPALPAGPADPAEAGRFGSELRAGVWRHSLAAMIAAGLLLAGPAVTARLSAELERGSSLPLPERIGAAAAAGPVQAPTWLRTEAGWASRHVTYAGGALPFAVHVFEGGAGAARRDLTGMREQLAEDTVTLVADRPMAALQGQVNRGPPMREMRLQHAGREVLVAYWLAVGPEGTANPITAKLLEVRTIFAGEHIKPAMVAVAMDTKGLDQPGASLQAIAADVAASIAACFEPAERENRQCRTYSAVAQ